MALGEARSGSGQNFWSVLAQGLAGGAAAVPNALQQEKQNKLAKMGAIFDAQRMIMAQQEQKMQMSKFLIDNKIANEQLKALVKQNSTYESPEQKQARLAAAAAQETTDNMSAIASMRELYGPNNSYSAGGLTVNPESADKPTQKSWQAMLIDSMGVDAFTKWYKTNQSQMKEAGPEWANSYTKYLDAMADQNFMASFDGGAAQPVLSFNEYKAQYGGGAAPVAENPAPDEGEGGDEDARLQELLDLISK